VRGAGRDVNDVSVDKILRPSIPNAASLCSAVAVSFSIYHCLPSDQSCFSLRDNKDVIIVCVDFGSPGRSANGKLDGMRFCSLRV